MSITLRLAWRNLWRQPRRTWLTAGAMVFSNVLLIFLIALQLGTYQAMIDNTLGAFSGHLQVQRSGYKENQRIRQVVPRIRDVAEELRSGLGLNSVAARGEAFALASSASRTYGIRIIGVEPEFEPRASRIPSLVNAGRFLDDPVAPEIVVGEILALNLKAQVGDELTILGSARDGSFAAAVVNIVGIFDSGLDELDRSLAQMPLEFFQKTFAMNGAGHAVVINAPGLFEVESVAEKANSLLPRGQNLVVHDWNDLQPGLRQAIQADLIGSWFMYGILVILVMFSVLNTQLMSVLERTKEFGIVLSLGLSSGRLGRLVLLETVLIGLIGLALGVALGGIATSWFEAHGFTYPGMEEMAQQFNVPDRFYPDLNAISLFAGPVVVFAGSVLAAIYPMARLHWLRPVQAMRSA